MRPLLPTSDEERLRLIGELLCKGILCSPSLRTHGSDNVGVPHNGRHDPEQRIVDYLGRNETASPSEMQAVLQLSRSGTHRALQRLLITGQIVSNGGRTSTVAYRLIDPSRN